MDNGEVKWFFN